MKKLNSILFTAIVIFTILNASWAQISNRHAKYQVQGNGIPAKSDLITYTQPDGSVIHIFLKGDRAIHWAESTDGYSLLSNPNGFYEYAKNEQDGKMVSSGIVAHDSNARTIEELLFLKTIPKNIFFSEDQLLIKSYSYKPKDKSNLKSFPASGTPHNLVLMIQFSDLSFTYTVSDLNNLMNKSNYGGIGSFKDFYYYNSNGLLAVNTLVDGIYTAPYTHDYYGQNDINGDDLNVDQLVSSLILGADTYIDFSQYDNDGDGVVDGVYVIYAGTGEASSGNPNDIWPHNTPSITPIVVDGVTVNSYTCSNEIDGSSMAGIGTICHEFGHALGLPDFYDTDYSGSGGQAEGTGSWDVMCGGNYNGNGAYPANHNPLSKEMLGWQTSGNIVSNGTYMLPPAENDTLVGLIPSSSSNEGFLYENRQLLGFDDSLKGHGLLVYHYDLNYFTQTHLDNNDINVNPFHQGFDIEEADYETSDETGDTYPGITNKTSFTDVTFPSSVLWSGSNFGHPITNISENSGNITFNVGGFAGISNIFSSENFKVYPTLASENIYISSIDDFQNISIKNLLGVSVLENKTKSKQMCLDVSKIENGTYILKVQTSKGITNTKIIVSH